MTNAHFSREDRLTKPSEFERVFKNPKKSTSRFFTVLACRNNLGHSRLGLAIAKKNIALSVQRNHIKRLVRESFRQQGAMLGGLDIVVMARKGADQASRDTLRDTLQQQWEQLV